MRWPWSRRDAEETSPPDGAPVSAPAPLAHRDWASVPAIQPAVPVIQRAADVDRFTSTSFTSWQSPAVLAPLAHAISPDAPVGLVAGLTSNLAPVTHRPGAAPAAVQRSAAPATHQLRTFPTPLLGPRLVASEPAPAALAGLSAEPPTASPTVDDPAEVPLEPPPAVGADEPEPAPEPAAPLSSPLLGAADVDLPRPGPAQGPGGFEVPGSTPMAAATEPAAPPAVPVQRKAAPSDGPPDAPLLGAVDDTPKAPAQPSAPSVPSPPRAPVVHPPSEPPAASAPPAATIQRSVELPAAPGDVRASLPETLPATTASAVGDDTLPSVPEPAPESGPASNPEVPTPTPTAVPETRPDEASAPLLGAPEAAPLTTLAEPAAVDDPTLPTSAPAAPIHDSGLPGPRSVFLQRDADGDESPPFSTAPVWEETETSGAPVSESVPTIGRRLGLGEPIKELPGSVNPPAALTTPNMPTRQREAAPQAPPEPTQTRRTDGRQTPRGASSIPAAEPAGQQIVAPAVAQRTAPPAGERPHSETRRTEPRSAGSSASSFVGPQPAGQGIVAPPVAQRTAPLLGELPAPQTRRSEGREASRIGDGAPTSVVQRTGAPPSATMTAQTQTRRTEPGFAGSSASRIGDPSAIAVGAGIAQRQADGSIVFRSALEANLLSGHTVTVGQRPGGDSDGESFGAGASHPDVEPQSHLHAHPSHSPAVQRAASDDSAPPPAPVSVQPEAAAAPAPGPSGGAGAGNLDELAKQLYGRIRTQLVAELRVDRERAGLGVGLER